MTAYLTQALKVRPYDGHVLLVAGQEALLVGDSDRAIQLWKSAFQTERKIQYQLLQLLARQVTVQFILETFQPDLAAGVLREPLAVDPRCASALSLRCHLVMTASLVSDIERCRVRLRRHGSFKRETRPMKSVVPYSPYPPKSLRLWFSHVSRAN